MKAHTIQSLFTGKPPTQPTNDGQDMFRVDVGGLRRKFAHRSKNFLVYELYQNAVDEDVTQITMKLEKVSDPSSEDPEAPFLVRLFVEDDSPEGFKDLSHSYTMYADSSKLDNPEQRGIWNLGEKLVLAFCVEAEITTTKGTVSFRDGRRFHKEERRPKGTTFEGFLHMKPAEFDDCLAGVRQLIPPGDIAVHFNETRLEVPEFIHEFTVTLPTTIGDEEGAIRRTRRKTQVRIYDPFDGGPGMIYEMGIPVVETGDKWHYDVQQRVPLNMLRDNVTPAYLQEIRVAVFNETHDLLLEEEDVTTDWARASTNDKRCSPEATAKALDLRFGEKRVSYDVSDPEANKKAMAEGFAVVAGGSLSKQEWQNAKAAEAIKPAGQVTPTHPVEENPSQEVQRLEWTESMQLVERYVHRIAPELVEHDVEVRIVCKPTWPVQATYGHRGGPLTFNLGTLGHKFFSDRTWEGLQRINELLIHEFAHEYACDHFSRQFYDSMGLIGARLAKLALEKPEIISEMVTEGRLTEGLFWSSHPANCE